jgi:hypothetical protein
MPRSCSYNDDLLPSEILTPKGGITAKIQISPKHQKWESPGFSDNRYSLYLAHPPCLSFFSSFTGFRLLAGPRSDLLTVHIL